MIHDKEKEIRLNHEAAFSKTKDEGRRTKDEKKEIWLIHDLFIEGRRTKDEGQKDLSLVDS